MSGDPNRGPFFYTYVYDGSKPMPRGHVNKQEIQTRVYKLKTALYDSTDMFNCFSDEKKAGAHDALNRVLDILQEYRE